MSIMRILLLISVFFVVLPTSAKEGLKLECEKEYPAHDYTSAVYPHLIEWCVQEKLRVSGAAIAEATEKVKPVT